MSEPRKLKIEDSLFAFQAGALFAAQSELPTSDVNEIPINVLEEVDSMLAKRCTLEPVLTQTELITKELQKAKANETALLLSLEESRATLNKLIGGSKKGSLGIQGKSKEKEKDEEGEPTTSSLTYSVPSKERQPQRRSREETGGSIITNMELARMDEDIYQNVEMAHSSSSSTSTTTSTATTTINITNDVKTIASTSELLLQQEEEKENQDPEVLEDEVSYNSNNSNNNNMIGGEDSHIVSRRMEKNDEVNDDTLQLARHQDRASEVDDKQEWENRDRDEDAKTPTILEFPKLRQNVRRRGDNTNNNSNSNNNNSNSINPNNRYAHESTSTNTNTNIHHDTTTTKTTGYIDPYISRIIHGNISEVTSCELYYLPFLSTLKCRTYNVTIDHTLCKINLKESLLWTLFQLYGKRDGLRLLAEHINVIRIYR
jgi:hypothetical protein